jgi:hypothetical protein
MALRVLEGYIPMGEASRLLGVSAISARRILETQKVDYVTDPLGHRWVLRPALMQLIQDRAEGRRGTDAGPDRRGGDQ